MPEIKPIKLETPGRRRLFDEEVIKSFIKSYNYSAEVVGARGACRCVWGR